jgi:hypothetical protein
MRAGLAASGPLELLLELFSASNCYGFELSPQIPPELQHTAHVSNYRAGALPFGSAPKPQLAGVKALAFRPGHAAQGVELHSSSLLHC